MTKLLLLVALLVTGGVAPADSGGPYEGVPDLKGAGSPDVFAIPATKEPLDFYLKHIPRRAWDNDLKGPGYTWEPIVGYHATFRILGDVRGRMILELRYVSRERIAQGLDFAEILILLAKGFDNGPDANLCTAIYYSSGGATYNRTASYLPAGDKYGAVAVTRHYDGNGSHRVTVGIRGTKAFQFERFDPSEKKDTREEAPARSDSK